MIDGLKPYPTMKDTGVPWLGMVPEHWAVLRLGALLRERGETNDDNSMTEVLSVMRQRGVIPYAEKGNVGNKKSEDITRYKIVRPDDIVVNCMNVIIGSVGLSEHTGCLSPVYYVLTRRSKADDPRYLNAYFQTKPFQLSLVRIGNGILAHRMRIPMELLKCQPFPRPPSDEQAAIVRFLNHANARIRRYIHAKQKLINLLEEEKRAIIQRVVSQGLDPNVRFKPSHVEWLGDVPEHWDVVPLKFVSKRIQNGATPPSSEPSFYENGTIPWYGPSSCGYCDQVGPPVRHVSEAAFSAGRARLIKGPALLVVVIGATAGRMTVLADIGSTNQQITSYELDDLRVDARFVLKQLRGAEHRLRSTASTATIPILDAGVISRLPVALPNLLEQKAILGFAGGRTAGQSEAIDRANREISFLREYRTRLIADLVTGKLDVREAAEKLSGEIPEPKLLDEVGDLPQDGATADDSDLEAADAA